MPSDSPNIPDYSAELFVAGRFADAGWNVYFPHRDMGFDFVVSKQTGGEHQMLRPVQVKGKYPEPGTSDRTTYGFVGRLSELHAEMVLAIPFYPQPHEGIPSTVAYMPSCELRPHSRGVRCEPAKLRGLQPEARPGFAGFFDLRGLRLLESVDWSQRDAASYEWL